MNASCSAEVNSSRADKSQADTSRAGVEKAPTDSFNKNQKKETAKRGNNGTSVVPKPLDHLLHFCSELAAWTLLRRRMFIVLGNMTFLIRMKTRQSFEPYENLASATAVCLTQNFENWLYLTKFYFAVKMCTDDDKTSSLLLLLTSSFLRLPNSFT